MTSNEALFQFRSLTQALKKESKMLFAYIYGSVLLRRDARDIDIAVYMDEKEDHWAAAQEIAVRLKKSLNYSRKVDTHPLNGTSPSFAFEVMKNGRVMFERKKDDRLNWEVYMLSRYQDIRPMLEFYDRRYVSK